MKPGALLLAAAVAILAGAAFLPSQAANGPGPAWQGTSPDGHSLLAEALAAQGKTRALSGSLNLLPQGAGPGDVLFLFPSYRPPRPGETARLLDFAAAGGTVVAAADGGASREWFDAFGLPAPTTLPLLAPPRQGLPCVEVGLADVSACLASPSSFPGTVHDDAHPSGIVGTNASAPVFLDLDGDGTLSLGDQGPVNLTLALRVGVGAGQVIAIADGDLWRNAEATESPSNLLLAQRLAADARATYIDSTGSDRGALSPASAYRALSAPTAVQLAGLLLLPVAIIVATLLVPRARPWLAHRRDPAAEDPAAERAAAALLSRSGPSRPSSQTDQQKTS